MDYAVNFISVIQVFFAIVIGLYFWNMLRAQQGSRVAVEKEAKKEMDRLQRMRAISLTEPLAEKTRPAVMADIVGQEDGLKALRAALCGPNPQHVLIFGPPGVGKTAAARLILEEAKRNPISPFGVRASFVELDATTARFDERGIADPLIGSVHDPIYQGAGALGVAGIPQPKPGAVTKAHGGMLFIDEIGELHPLQMNKLLKVLEDRKVFLESSYYNSEDTNIPTHIHDIFQNGLPADFRLVGATTRLPHELPPALRSRCIEIIFRPLLPNEVATIASQAASKLTMGLEERALQLVSRYCTNGREAVNLVQLAAGLAINEGRCDLAAADIEWVLHFSQATPQAMQRIGSKPQVGLVNGLAVTGAGQGVLMEIEVTAAPNPAGCGEMRVTGVVEEEELGRPGHIMRRKSMARSSLENIRTVLGAKLGIDWRQYDVHVNFPGGVPVDGTSAGLSMAVAMYSAIRGIPVAHTVAMTGELSLRGLIKPVGGIAPKLFAAKQAGAQRVLIPQENWQESPESKGLDVRGVATLDDALALALSSQEPETAAGCWEKESLCAALR